MGELLNMFIQDHVFIDDEDEEIDDHQKIEELPQEEKPLQLLQTLSQCVANQDSLQMCLSTT